MKKCSRCERLLPATPSYFYRHKNMKDGFNTVCKECEGHKFGQIRPKHESKKEGFKICTKCKRELPETTRYFFKQKRGKNGLMSYCKECAGWRYTIRATYNDNHKKCPSCKMTLPYTNAYFSKSKHTKSGLSATCKSCLNERGKKHYQVNKEIIDKSHRKYYRLNKEKVNLRIKEYRINNPEKVKVVWQKRQARIKKLPYNFSGEDWVQCQSHFNNKCAYCGKYDKLTQDHFIPLNNGGEYTKQNIIPACLSCNSSKSDKNFFLWYREKEFYSKQREEKILKYLNYKNNTQQLALL